MIINILITVESFLEENSNVYFIDFSFLTSPEIHQRAERANTHAAFGSLSTHTMPQEGEENSARQFFVCLMPFRCVLSRLSVFHCSLWPGKWLLQHYQARIMISLQNLSETWCSLLLLLFIERLR